jgi:hypothetical protein
VYKIQKISVLKMVTELPVSYKGNSALDIHYLINS